jgi:hypothetical protein
MDDNRNGVRVPAFGVQVGVGVVFGDAPHAVSLVRESGPALVAGEEASDPRLLRCEGVRRSRAGG